MHGHNGTAKEKAIGWRKLQESALRSADVSSGAKYLWHLLHSYANLDGSNCHPSMETLCEDSLHDVKWIKRHINELKDAAWLTVGKKKTRTGWVNLYHFHWSAIGPPKAGRDRPKMGLRGKAQKRPTTISQRTHVEPEQTEQPDPQGDETSPFRNE